jgi:hypothetical protein
MAFPFQRISREQVDAHLVIYVASKWEYAYCGIVTHDGRGGMSAW